MREYPETHGSDKDLQKYLVLKEKIAALGDHREELKRLLKIEIRKEEGNAWRYKTQSSYDKISELRSILYLIDSLLRGDRI